MPPPLDYTAPIENDLLLRALKGETLSRPPVWLMRQAGRYLPEYQALRKTASFFERCENPALVTEITLQPVRRLAVDAAILFSDILVVPRAMGMEVHIIEQKGPFLPEPIQSEKDLARISASKASEKLDFVYTSIKAIKKSLKQRIPLIGFAGAPFTILCYMVEGQGSKGFEKTKAFCLQHTELAHELLGQITTATIAYLQGQIRAGVDVVQLFDSWAGVWDKHHFLRFCLPYLKEIVAAMTVPAIVFAKGAWYALPELQETGAAALGIDGQTPPHYAREQTKNSITLQGNLDPSLLFLPEKDLIKATHKMLADFGTERYIANLGHGILPGVSVEKVQCFVNTIKAYRA